VPLTANFWRIFAADFILRTAYQMGKTPLLPLFAAALGAGDLLIGTIASISTATGMFLKPLFGILSDRWGRRVWFFLALAIFIGTPFLYSLVDTVDQLLALRAFHGVATAIFGPVSLAYVAEMDRRNIGTRLGIFGMARGGGYLLAPAIAGWLLTVMPAEQVFILIGCFSAVAMVPIMVLNDRRRDSLPVRPGVVPLSLAAKNLAQDMVHGIASAARRREVWTAGFVELCYYIITYALKAFLPIYAVSEMGLSIFVAGLFFTLQETAHILCRPAGGYLSDRIGHLPAVGIGMLLQGFSLFALLAASTGSALMMVAVAGGLAQGLISPATVAFVSAAVDDGRYGATLGVFGALRNVGKVVGPIVIGAFLQVYSFVPVFQVLAVTSILTVLVISIGHQARLRQRRA
jgi:MFS family permease